MDITNLVIFLVIGALAGWIAGSLMKGKGYGIIGNMVIGIIVNVMDGENQKVRSEEALEANEPTIKDIYLKLEALEARLEYTSEKSQWRE